MKKFNLRLATDLKALMTIGVFNFKYAYEGYGNAVNKMAGTATGGTGTNGGTADDGCCAFWSLKKCNQRRYSTYFDLDCTTQVTTVYHADMSVFGSFNVLIKGKADVKAQQKVAAAMGVSGRTTKTVTSGYKLKSQSKVACPSDGSCNNCEEYTTTCD